MNQTLDYRAILYPVLKLYPNTFRREPAIPMPLGWLFTPNLKSSKSSAQTLVRPSWPVLS